ncbi:phosphate/phosphite/phosphonate ABC transporter substrate-binding protein [Fluviispira vulneris]|uniref:phosphate/phosphite/phosphonate ABC transporter substrate-binding protein n=1 Tax=Fluviispira vulneris TaxID=2763012 RepID=UPI001648A5E1|nr:phosphate/phosphite/phosphonate ABC transporter substrate-binding protein [Fluviispira vulneris]
MLNKRFLFVLFALFSMTSSNAAESNSNTKATSEVKLGTRNNPFKIAIVPSGQAAKALDSAKPVAKCIEQKSKIFVDVQVPNSYIAVVEAIGAQKADLAFGDIVSFLIAKKRFNAEPFLEITRYGSTSYQSAIFVKANSNIKSVSDLNNKKFAYSDASSASSYIYPAILMKKNNKKFAQELATGSMDASIIALMQGQVDATAAYYNNKDPVTGKENDARVRVENIYPNIYKETRIIWLSSLIPNEPVYLRKGVSEDIKQKLAVAIPECIKEFPKYINNISELNPITADNKNYENFVKEVETSGLDISNIFSKK